LSSGKRHPTALERVGQHGGLQGNPKLRAEQAINADIGAKFGTKKRRIIISLYGRSAKDLIDWTSTSFGRAKPVNRAQVELVGLRISARHHSRYLSLSGAARWQEEWAREAAQATRTQRLVSSPRGAARLTAWWRRNSWGFGMMAAARSSIFLDPANLRTLGGQVLLSAALERSLDQKKGHLIRLSIENLLDQQTVMASRNPGGFLARLPLQDRWGQPLPGRVISVALILKENR
jgi:outer membrane cobalamin receptor